MIKLKRPALPPDIDADISIAIVGNNISSLLSESSIPIKESFVFNGMHERTGKGDSLMVSAASSSKRHQVRFSLKRNSLYHTLPEYLFHPLDRYANCDGDKETFLENRTAQKQIEQNALEYFHPFDTILTRMRVGFQDHLNSSILDNESFIIDFITENESINKNNLYIRRALPYILQLRANRGSKALITVLVNEVFGSGLVDYSCRNMENPVEIDSTACHITLEGVIDDLFCGETIMDWSEVFEIKYQLKLKTHEDIEQTARNIEDFIKFASRWFLSANQMFNVVFGDFSKEPIISDSAIDGELFLNYNTQLLVS